MLKLPSIYMVSPIYSITKVVVRVEIAFPLLPIKMKKLIMTVLVSKMTISELSGHKNDLRSRNSLNF